MAYMLSGFDGLLPKETEDWQKNLLSQIFSKNKYKIFITTLKNGCFQINLQVLLTHE